jgi:hypothetical protein
MAPLPSNREQLYLTKGEGRQQKPASAHAEGIKGLLTCMVGKVGTIFTNAYECPAGFGRWGFRYYGGHFFTDHKKVRCLKMAILLPNREHYSSPQRLSS